MWWGLYSQLPRTGEQLDKHLVSLRRLASRAEDRELFNHLYEALTTLDRKSTSLLQFDSVFIAVYAISLEQKTLIS